MRSCEVHVYPAWLRVLCLTFGANWMLKHYICDFKLCCALCIFPPIYSCHFHCVMYVKWVLPWLYLKKYDSQCTQTSQNTECFYILINICHWPPCFPRYRHQLSKNIIGRPLVYIGIYRAAEKKSSLCIICCTFLHTIVCIYMYIM